MERDYVQISAPGDGTVLELNTAKALIDYLDKSDRSIELTDKEAELIVNYLAGHDYMLGVEDEVLLRGDLAESDDAIYWEFYTIDDAIDMACEWNYELILEADEKRRNPDNFVSYIEADKYYSELKADEIILDKLFEKTKYYIGIEQLARTLAEQFLNNLKSMEDKRDIDGLTSQVVNQVKQYSSGRSR